MAQMTFLQLVQKLREKCGAAGTGPVTTAAQVGESLRLVNWVNEAWDELQSLHTDWKWMRKDFSFPTASGKIAYLPTATVGEALIASFANWHDDTFRLYNTALGRVDEQWLVGWDYDVFRDTYDFGLQSTTLNRPQVWARRDSDSALLLGPSPDGIYTVTGQYQAAPTLLAADADVPGLPARFHMLIVYKAMLKYAAFEAAPEVHAEATSSGSGLLTRLEIDQLDAISFGEPLA